MYTVPNLTRRVLYLLVGQRSSFLILLQSHVNNFYINSCYTKVKGLYEHKV